MFKPYKYRLIFICGLLLLEAATGLAAENDYIKNIEIAAADINIDYNQFPPAAFLCVALKNIGDREVSNLTFEIKYYEKEEYFMQKAIVKNPLNQTIPQGETRKYKIRLKGDIVNIENAQYPYDQSNNVDKFAIKITNVKFASRK